MSGFVRDFHIENHNAFAGHETARFGFVDEFVGGKF
jgi:hypothetical protein